MNEEVDDGMLATLAITAQGRTHQVEIENRSVPSVEAILAIDVIDIGEAASLAEILGARRGGTVRRRGEGGDLGKGLKRDAVGEEGHVPDALATGLAHGSSDLLPGEVHVAVGITLRQLASVGTGLGAGVDRESVLGPEGIRGESDRHDRPRSGPVARPRASTGRGPC